ncbi:hypothetical protein N5P37_007159 [Trichoderma harzianum]|uniref:Uncharacterized protein n=1 Tax=Trichoderma harzianum CBS 226.95 TaxID=983964 RepID=A0A2T4AKM2_TRIHA|nr:hypothetical protein M431DRAFT_491720 [Trichoderma harzianum CBS 226.95]KAK0760080.1 hypothetical protein N5P37_007159 [Trichoderma harzianum]PKK50817.1 hypothetical protein CI102_5086 [Trichoderma harzianum]PTB57488.1 hypothetical protein M431DRAFT_491720 [Trichoderma harzianum CBS 226.95]
MHLSQLLLGIVASATAAVGLTIPIGPLATIYSEPNFQGESYVVDRVDDCVQLPANVIGNVNSVKLEVPPSPYYVSCTLFSNDYCRNPGASAIFYAMSLFDNTVIPDPKVRSVLCTISRLLP